MAGERVVTSDQLTLFVRSQRDVREETTPAGERPFFTDLEQQEPARVCVPTTDEQERETLEDGRMPAGDDW